MKYVQKFFEVKTSPEYFSGEFFCLQKNVALKTDPMFTKYRVTDAKGSLTFSAGYSLAWSIFEGVWIFFENILGSKVSANLSLVSPIIYDLILQGEILL